MRKHLTRGPDGQAAGDFTCAIMVSRIDVYGSACVSVPGRRPIWTLHSFLP